MSYNKDQGEYQLSNTFGPFYKALTYFQKALIVFVYICPSLIWVLGKNNNNNIILKFSTTNRGNIKNYLNFIITLLTLTVFIYLYKLLVSAL